MLLSTPIPVSVAREGMGMDGGKRMEAETSESWCHSTGFMLVIVIMVDLCSSICMYSYDVMHV